MPPYLDFRVAAPRRTTWAGLNKHRWHASFLRPRAVEKRVYWVWPFVRRGVTIPSGLHLLCSRGESIAIDD